MKTKKIKAEKITFLTWTNRFSQSEERVSDCFFEEKNGKFIITTKDNKTIRRSKENIVSIDSVELDDINSKIEKEIKERGKKESIARKKIIAKIKKNLKGNKYEIAFYSNEYKFNFSKEQESEKVIKISEHSDEDLFTKTSHKVILKHLNEMNSYYLQRFLERQENGDKYNRLALNYCIKKS